MTDPLAGYRNKGNKVNTNAQNAGQQTNPMNRVNKSQVQDGFDYVKQHGGDPKAACIELLKSQGKPIPSNPFTMAIQLLIGGR